MITIEDVDAARTVVDRHLRRSPLEHSPFLTQSLDAEIHLKLENLRPTRSFKVRGALNRISQLDAAARERGVVTASGGNHGQGVAYAAYVLGTSATVVMPLAVAPSIAEVCRAYGARVLLQGQIYDDTLALAHEIEEREGRTFVHPFEDPQVIAGQGTIGLEILEDLPDVETILVPVGGGGLLCGIALAVKERSNGRVRVIGVEPEGSDNVARSVAAGHPVALEAPRSVAERLVAKSTGELNVELARRYVDGFVTVTDEAIERAVFEHFDRLSLLVEPSGAATLAAVRSRSFRAIGRTVLVVSGGNVPAPTLARVLSAGSGLPDASPSRDASAATKRSRQDAAAG